MEPPKRAIPRREGRGQGPPKKSRGDDRQRQTHMEMRIVIDASLHGIFVDITGTSVVPHRPVGRSEQGSTSGSWIDGLHHKVISVLALYFTVMHLLG